MNLIDRDRVFDFQGRPLPLNDQQVMALPVFPRATLMAAYDALRHQTDGLQDAVQKMPQEVQMMTRKFIEDRRKHIAELEKWL